MKVSKTPSSVLVGLECGGTKTVAIASTEALEPVARIESGACNLRLVSDAELELHFKHLAAQLPPALAIGVGMAGVRDRRDIDRVQAVIRRVWPDAASLVDHDLESALSAADLHGGDLTRSRVIVLSGTGSCCFGRSPGGSTAKVGGWGHHLGDRGSAFDIVHKALRAAALHLDHTGKWCGFGERALRATLQNGPNDLIGWMQGASKSEVAALAPEVFAAASGGDRIARRVLQETEEALAADAVACVRKLGKAPADIFFAGSVVLRQQAFALRIARRIRKALPDARVQSLRRESAWGAVVMAKRARGSAGTQKHGGASPAQTSPSPNGMGPVLPRSTRLSPTEERNPRSLRLDRLPLRKAIDLMIDEEASVAERIRVHRAQLERLIRKVSRALEEGGRLFYVGAGTSGRLGVLDASECPPTFRTPPELIQGIIAGGLKALHSAVEGAEDDCEAGAAALVGRGIGSKDVVLGIAASGRTPFVWGALHEAHRCGAFTALLCFNPYLIQSRKGPPDLMIAMNTGPEVLTGSTRLKAGTATKLVLNILTTLSMVRLGKVMGNLMVDLNPSNVKLRDRAVRMVSELTGTERDRALAALEAESWIVTHAVARIGLKS